MTGRHALLRTALPFMLAVSALPGCRGAGDAGSDSAAGALDASAVVSEADALRALERPVDFALSEARLEQLLTARERLARVEDAAAAEALALDVRSSSSAASEEDIAEVVERLQRSADTRRAIEGSAISVRDYVEGIMALQQAVLASRLDERGPLPPPIPANVQVVQRNPDRVAQLTSGSPFAEVVAAASGLPGRPEGLTAHSTGDFAARSASPADARVPRASSDAEAPSGGADRARYDGDGGARGDGDRGRGKGKKRGKRKD